jgi:hypothetical protein
MQGNFLVLKSCFDNVWNHFLATELGKTVTEFGLNGLSTLKRVNIPMTLHALSHHMMPRGMT